MKKIFLTVLAALLCAGAFAQGDFSFGVKAGVAGNWIPGTTVLPDDTVLPNFGFYGGAAGALGISRSSAIQVELLYARKGIMTKGELFENRYVRNIHYLQVPVLFSKSMAGDRYKVMVGPEFGYALGTTVSNSVGQKDPASADALNRFNLAAVLQTTYFVTDGLGVDVKFDFGITKTFAGGNDNGHNASLQIGLCYFFNN